MDKKKSTLLENSLAWYKVHNGSLAKHPSVTTQTRLLRECSISMAIYEEPHGADPSPISVTLVCLRLLVQG